MPGPHGPEHRTTNIGGCYSLVSNEYGAWKFTLPYTLTSEDMDAIGVPEDKIRSRGIGHATYELTEDQETYVNNLMAYAPLTYTSFANVASPVISTQIEAAKTKSCSAKKRKT